MIKKEIFSNGVFIIFIVDSGARIHFANLVRGQRFNGGNNNYYFNDYANNNND